MAQARQVVESKEAHLAQVQQDKERLRADIVAKEKEVQQLNNRWAAACYEQRTEGQQSRQTYVVGVCVYACACVLAWVWVCGCLWGP